MPPTPDTAFPDSPIVLDRRDGPYGEVVLRQRGERFEIIVNGWVRLEDDKHTQPADNIAPLVRNDYLAKVDKAAFSKLLDDISAKIDTPTLADLYKQVAVDKKGWRH